MLFVLLALMSAVVGVRSDCTFATSTSSYDLSPLTQTSGTDYKVSNNGIDFFFNLCSPVLTSHGCATYGPAVLSVQSVAQCRNLVLPNAGAPVVKPVEATGNGGLTLSYSKSGDSCTSAGGVAPYSLDLSLTCDPTADTISALSVTNVNCLITIKGTSQYACPTTMSSGWIFVIIVLVGFSVYFIGGALYLHFVKGQRGSELIPNYEFWRDLPGLIKDGCSYFVLRVRQCLGQAPTETYNTVPEGTSSYGSTAA